MASQDRQLSSPSILSAGAQELPKKHVVTEVTVAIFIWAVAKQYCKKNPAETFKELKVNILHGLQSAVTEKTWKGVHKKVYKFEDIYHDEMATDPLIDLDKLEGIWEDEDNSDNK